MKDFRQNDFFHTDLDEARQSRQAVDLALVDDASRRPVGHGLDTAGPAIGKIRHHRLEGRNFLIEQGFHRFDGHVALGQARTAAGDDQVDAADPFMEMAFDFGLVVFDNLIVDDLMAVVGQSRLNEQAVRIVRKAAAVADRENRRPQGMFFHFFTIQDE